MKSIYEEFIWFNGVVENRDDPLKLGRCKVRCLGFHTSDKSILPTEDLPWALPIMPITSASVSGVGSSPVGPVEGTWVVGYFRDGKSAQEPVMMGTMPGIPQESAKPNEGFNDPNSKYPLEDHIGEPDTSRIARNEKIEETIIKLKQDNLDTMDSVGIDGGSITEPVTKYAASYPLNKVVQSESGHVIEIDDTPDSERLHIYHKSGTFLEVHPDGTLVVKTKGGHLSWNEDSGNVHITGNMNITVDGNSNIYTKGDLNIKTEGNVKHDVVDGNYELNVGGQVLINGGGGGSSIKMTGSNISLKSGSINLN